MKMNKIFPSFQLSVSFGTSTILCDDTRRQQIKPVSVKCRVQTADCRLQTGGKMKTRGKMQTEHCRPGVKCRLYCKDYLFKVKTLEDCTHVQFDDGFVQ